MSTSPYPSEFVRRQKGQRRTPVLISELLFASELPAGYSVVVVGSFKGSSGFGGVQEFESLVVTLPSGVRVPAYRVPSPENCYAICQNLSYGVVK